MTAEQTRLVTISASYGAGGSVVAPALAARLGVPFLQRATSSAGAPADLDPCFERLEPDEADLVPAHRLLSAFANMTAVGPSISPMPSTHDEHALRRYCEESIFRLAHERAGVILGRGAAVALGRDRGFHVRLDGPPGRRLVQGAAIEAISEDEARRHMAAADRARDAYVRRLYRANGADTKHYHLVIDSTVMPLDTVTEIILRALSAYPPKVPVPRDERAASV
jgi:cytidylate kinase